MMHSTIKPLNTAQSPFTVPQTYHGGASTWSYTLPHFTHFPRGSHIVPGWRVNVLVHSHQWWVLHHWLQWMKLYNSPLWSYPLEPISIRFQIIHLWFKEEAFILIWISWHRLRLILRLETMGLLLSLCVTHLWMLWLFQVSFTSSRIFFVISFSPIYVMFSIFCVVWLISYQGVER